MSKINVRFAPSPTGKLHVGNLRTALVNYLYARQQNGQFMLRIDDTDEERSRPEFETAIRNDLKWMGMKWDCEDRQSARLARYDEALAHLFKLYFFSIAKLQTCPVINRWPTGHKLGFTFQA